MWLDDPDSASLPDGWGAWTDIFARLYRLRRDDERNRTELNEWLARFRQAMTCCRTASSSWTTCCSSNGATRRPSGTWA